MKNKPTVAQASAEASEKAPILSENDKALFDLLVAQHKENKPICTLSFVESFLSLWEILGTGKQVQSFCLKAKFKPGELALTVIKESRK